jgi:hypothetical protein
MIRNNNDLFFCKIDGEVFTEKIKQKIVLEMLKYSWMLTNAYESFSERFTKMGPRFLKILETWQFGYSFNIINQVLLTESILTFSKIWWMGEVEKYF